jgi:hypothetical protein
MRSGASPSRLSAISIRPRTISIKPSRSPRIMRKPMSIARISGRLRTSRSVPWRMPRPRFGSIRLCRSLFSCAPAQNQNSASTTAPSRTTARCCSCARMAAPRFTRRAAMPITAKATTITPSPTTTNRSSSARTTAVFISTAATSGAPRTSCRERPMTMGTRSSCPRQSRRLERTRND